MNFINQIEDVFSESPIDPVRPALDPVMFDEDEELKPEIMEFLKKIVDDIDKNVVPVIGKSLIKGSILSYQWLPHTDVDLLVEIDENINDHQWDVIGDQIEERYDGLFIPGTKHPLQVFAKRGKYDIADADGVYDLYRGWVKGPYSHKVDVQKYMDEFRDVVQNMDLTAGELRRDLIDYDILNDLGEDEIKGLKAQLRAKLDEIDQGVDSLLFQRQAVKDARRDAFDRDMTLDEIKEFGSKNLLPANVIQKMLERYHYMNILSKMKKIKDDDDKLDDDDIEELNDIFNIEGLNYEA